MLYTAPVLSQVPQIAIVRKVEVPKPPAPIIYKVIAGDTLESIASEHNLTVSRLFSKNTNVVDPNIIDVGLELVIPTADEVLAERAVPIDSKLIPPKSGVLSSGNLYTPGNCTWYVKSLRPELPNNLGNGNTWFTQAARDGLAVGYTPKVGAVAAAISYNHVALVTAVHGDSIDITEMNFKGLYIISSRTAPISEFRYIY